MTRQVYVQYDPTTGFINSCVTADIAPTCDNQLAFPEGTITSNKQVNLTDLTLEDTP